MGGIGTIIFWWYMASSMTGPFIPCRGENKSYAFTVSMVCTARAGIATGEPWEVEGWPSGMARPSWSSFKSSLPSIGLMQMCPSLGSRQYVHKFLDLIPASRIRRPFSSLSHLFLAAETDLQGILATTYVHFFPCFCTCEWEGFCVSVGWFVSCVPGVEVALPCRLWWRPPARSKAACRCVSPPPA